MDAKEFRQAGREMVDYLADYLENIHERQVLPKVVPGYMKDLLPSDPPEEAESWDKIMPDIERVIMPGVTHWNHPNMHAYYPAIVTYPSILGEMLSAGISGVGFNWLANPAVTELEVIMLDWLAQLLNLPEAFMSSGKGGGVIQGSASESTLVAVLAARSKALKKAMADFPHLSKYELLDKLVCYASEQSHTSMDRAAMMACTRYKAIVSDGNDRMRGEALRKTIEKDKAAGLIPYFVQVTLGTTAQCAFDDLEELGPVCKEHSLWLHVDAALAGAAFICPEHRHHLNGIEYADTFNFNCHKWMLINFDCAPMWFRQPSWMVDAFNVDPEFLKHSHQHGSMPDFRHWQIPLGRRFRSLKIWFVLRSYGAEGVRNHIRKQCAQAYKFAEMIQRDSRFELTHDVSMSLVCFRIKNHENELTEKLLQRVVDDGRVYVVGASSKGVYFIRLAICAQRTSEESLRGVFEIFKNMATEVINEKLKISAV